MSAIWLDLSGKTDSLTIELLDRLSAVFRENEAPFVLIGATARDLILVHGYGRPIRRATQDVDCAILLKDWKKFEKIKAALLATGQFKATREPQRLFYREAIPVDLIPFGPLAENGVLSWPPDQSVQMSVLGLKEAYEQGRLIRLRREPPLDVRVAPLPLLPVLKLISWSDRSEERRKDALDLAVFLTAYLDAGNRERLHEEHADLLDKDFDYELAGARLLGRDMARTVSPPTRAKLLDLLARETANPEKSRLLMHMTDRTRQMAFERALALLEALLRGLREAGR